MNVITIKKFGGTSVGSLEKIEKVADRLAKCAQKGEQFAVVISAMSGQTDQLIKMANTMYPSYRGSAYDLLLSSGEQVSVSLLSMALTKRNIKNTPLLGYQVGIQTNSLFSKASIQDIQTASIKNILKKGGIPLVAGFQGVNTDNQITTLGRGGSDLTALALAVVLKQKVCEIYTDVQGVFTGDPRIVPSAKKIKELGFFEMMEMASLGSKVLQIRCVELAAKHNVSIHVRHAFKEEEGTWITKKEKKMEGSVVSAVAHDSNTVVIRVKKTPEKETDFMAHLFQSLGEKSIFVDIISKSEIEGVSALAFSIPQTDLNQCLSVLEKMVDKSNIEVVDQVVKVSVVGVGMAHHSGVAGRFFSVFKKLNVPSYLVTTSEIKISTIIDEKHLKKAVQSLHSEFKLSE